MYHSLILLHASENMAQYSTKLNVNYSRLGLREQDNLPRTPAHRFEKRSPCGKICPIALDQRYLTCLIEPQDRSAQCPRLSSRFIQLSNWKEGWRFGD